MKIFKEIIAYIISAFTVVIYIGAIGSEDILIAKVFAVMLYILPLVLISRNYLAKIPMFKNLKKSDNSVGIKRIKLVILILFTVVSIIMVFTGQYKYFSKWYLDLVVILITLLVLLGVAILLINFFFSDKTIFKNDKKTDEFITILMGIMFLGFTTIFFIDSLPMIWFILIYVGLICNFVVFIYKVIEAIVFFYKSNKSFFDIIKSISVIVFLMLSIIYIQNVLLYKEYTDAFSGIELNKYFDILYYTVTNLTSVGFGDIVPINYFAKIISMETSIFGYVLFITIFGLFISKTSEVFSAKKNKSDDKDDE